MKVKNGSLHAEIREALEIFVKNESMRFPAHETLTMDLHCHDKNSSEPDELLGRMLGIPETWIEPEDVMDVLSKHGCDAFTITNHNNARSCYDLLDKGFDILPGAEYSCTVPKYNVGIHVLSYGMTPEDDEKLNRLRGDVYKFLDYTVSRNIPTVCAHPLYHYKSDGIPSMDFFDHLMLLFNRFEVLNGQRDTWQNMLVKSWIESYTPERIEEISVRSGIPIERFLTPGMGKSLAGGSDSHMGIFTGLTGTRLHVPDLAVRIKREKRSQLALEAIRSGRMAPFGGHNDSEKMTIAFIDYLCQITMNMDDPGLLRILLHKGSARDKTLALFITNVFGELKRHKTTLSFMKVFHNSFKGIAPSVKERIFVKKEYRNVVNEVIKMAQVRKTRPHDASLQFADSLHSIFTSLNELAASRAKKSIDALSSSDSVKNLSAIDILERMEIPSRLRSLSVGKKGKGEFPMSSVSFGSIFDQLSFPVLGSAVILAASFAGARVMYNSRPLVREMSKRLNVFRHKPRILWLTDTFEDTNGVALVLKSMHAEIKKRNLPIDILVCSNNVKSDENLIVLKPVAEINPPFYAEQPLRIPDMMDVHKVFHEGEYDRIICSTEGVMGLASLYLKEAYSVPAYFFVHTDWMMFSRKVLKLDHHGRSRVRRILRTFYRQFDSLFVLNSDQRNWFTSSAMGFSRSRVFLTAHWAEEQFSPRTSSRMKLFGYNDNEPVMLFVGRISEEKGVMELPEVYRELKKKFPGVRLVIAGRGPAEEKLKKALPEAQYTGWVDHKDLPEMYSSADILILPSQFDTFGCVVLEALSCGLPAVSYATKGPKEIIENGVSGYLCNNRNEMISSLAAYLGAPEQAALMKEAALLRSKVFSSDKILTDMLAQIGIDIHTGDSMDYV